MTLLLGVGLALGSAFATNLGFLWRHRGANEAPDVSVRHPLKTVVGLFSSKWWSVGFAMAFVAWVLHIGAMAIAPLSIVQAVLAAGFVMLAVLADRFFGHPVGRRQWVGIVCTTVGLAFLALTAGSVAKEGTNSEYTPAAMIAFEVALVAFGLLAIAGRRTRLRGDRQGVLLGAAAGLLFTVTHVAIKAITGRVTPGDPATWLDPWLLLVVGGGVVAFFASARSLQLGEAVPVIAVTAVASNVSAMAAGVVVFGDSLGTSPFLVALRLAAFALVVIAAATIPGPLRAAKTQRERGSGTQPSAPGAQPATSS